MGMFSIQNTAENAPCWHETNGGGASSASVAVGG